MDTIAVHEELAKLHLRNLIEGPLVWIEFDSTLVGEGGTETSVAYLYRAQDRLFVNAQIIAGGYVLTATAHKCRHIDRFCARESDAEAVRPGL